MIDDINTKRTELANQMAAAGAANLDFTGTAAVLAAIPDTEPQQYVAAGTPENIAAILPATICPQRRQKHGDRPTEALVFDEPAATSGDAPDLQQLKALALAATPGPWHVTKYCSVMDQGMDTLVVSSDSSHEDRAYIAAASPAVVLGLIARIERAIEHVQPVNTSSERVENAAGNEQVERAAAPAPQGLAKQFGYPAIAPAASGDELPPLTMSVYGTRTNLELERQRRADIAVRAAVSAATKPKNEQIAEVIWHLIGNGVMDWKASESDEAEWDAMSNEEERRALIHEVNKALMAPAAATKPTADLSKLQRYGEVAEDDGSGEYVVKMANGDLVLFADVQSLLATKPAAAPDQSATIRILQSRVKYMEEKLDAHRPDFLLDGTRFKLNFSSRGNVDVFHNYAAELQGRWVALVPAEDDCHLAPAASTPAAPEVPQGWDVRKAVDQHYGEAFSVHGPDGSAVMVRAAVPDPTETVLYRYLAASTTGAAQTAEQVRGVEPRKVWSNNDEDFNFDTLDDLLDGGEYKPGDTVWVGEVAEPGLNELIDAEDVVDQMADRAHDIAGEHAEGYPDVSEDDKRELDVLLSGWIARCCPPNFYRVENVKPYVLSADDFPNDTTPVEAYGIPTPTHSSEAGDAS